MLKQSHEKIQAGSRLDPGWIQAGSRLDPDWIQPGSSLDPEPGPKGVLAGPGTPRDQNSHLFVTNRVAIRPFLAFLVRNSAEFRRGSRQIGPAPSISTFFGPFLSKTNTKMLYFDTFSKFFFSAPESPGKGPGGPWGPLGAQFPLYISPYFPPCGAPIWPLFFLL